MKYKLTPNQKELLSTLVKAIRNEGSGETFMDISAGAKHIIISSSGSKAKIIEVKSIEDLDVLVMNGLAIRDFTRNGSKKYTILQSAYDAVDNDFEIEVKTYPPSVGVQVFGDIRGGNVEGIGFANKSSIEQTINNPIQLQREIERLIESLISSISSDLSASQIAEYRKTTEELKKEFKSGQKKESNFRRIIATLSFINDTTSSIQLVVKVLPYIYMISQYIEKILVK